MSRPSAAGARLADRASAPDDQMPLSRFQQVLLGYDGTMTRMLEAYADEPVEAVKLHQDVARAGLDDGSGLGVGPGSPLLRRRVLLRGARTHRVLLHATAELAVERVPRPVVDALLTTSEPIGRVLAANRVETFREVVASGRQRAGGCGHHFGLPGRAEVLYRTYRVSSGGQPVLVITERFPAHAFLVVPDGPEAGGPEGTGGPEGRVRPAGGTFL